MGYIPKTDPLDLSIDFSRGPYIPATDPLGLDINFSAGSSIEYPIPPAIMVSSTLFVTSASSTPSGSSGLGYSMSPQQRAIRRALSSIMAGKEMDARAPQSWDRVQVKDEPIGDGVQAWGTGREIWPGDSSSAWDTVAIKDDQDGGIRHLWDDSIRPIDARESQGYNNPPAKDAVDSHQHADSALYWERYTPGGVGATFNGYIPGTDFNLRSGPYIPDLADETDLDLAPPDYVADIVVPTRPVFGGRSLQGWITNTPTDIRFRHPWDDKPRKGTEVDFDYDQQEPLPPKPEPDPPEIKEGYLFMNSSSIKKLPEGTPLEFEGLSVTLDIDSFSWALSARILNKSSMDLIRPGPAGPVEVEVNINGKKWRFMVDKYSREKKFPRETFRIVGSSLTQLLAAPYSPKGSAQIETPTNALQVIQDVLDLTGFSVQWDASLADYTIPAGAWGYEQKTPIEVIDELVKAAGGILVPTLSLSELRAVHRYREGAPWYWDQIDTAFLDFIIPDSTILGLSSQWEPNPEYNGVYVSGLTAGVAVDARKFGTAGDKPAPDDYNALNLTTQQCRGKAISILGQSGNQEIVTIEIPLPTSGAPGLVVPGQFGEIQDTATPADSWRALNLSTTISVAKPGSGRAVQVLKLERHHY